jgi:Flp pilus assembly protein TadD
MTIDFERSHGSPKEALLAAQDLLALEESLSGATSEPYLHAVQTLASLYETGGDNQRAIHLLRQAVVIGDLALPFNDARRGNTRTHLAFALTREKQFDEAERLVNEAIAIGKQMHPSQADQFVRQLEEIRKMRPAPTAKAGQP